MNHINTTNLQIPHLPLNHANGVSLDAQPTLPRPSASLRVKLLAVLHKSYMLLLLRLPLLYAARVRGDTVSPSVYSWSDLLPSLMTEWKMLQFISGALLSAILAIFQLTGAGASANLMMRTTGFVSFVCGFVGLMCSTLFIIHFVAQEASREGANGHTGEIVNMGDLEAGTVADASHQPGEVPPSTAEDIYGIWNMWVLISQPAVWTAWSIMTFALFILLFLWSTYPNPGAGLHTLVSPNAHLSRRDQVKAAPTPTTELLPRFVATVVLLIGVAYLVLAIRTLRSRMERT